MTAICSMYICICSITYIRDTIISSTFKNRVDVGIKLLNNLSLQLLKYIKYFLLDVKQPFKQDWLSLAVISCHWLSLAAIGCHWLSLAVIGCHWLSLAATGRHWPSLAVIGYHWLSLAVIGCHLQSFALKLKPYSM